MTAPNILLLDEPTNDLDIDTLMILEDYLESFQGAVLAVSHDRYFLDKIANLIFDVQENGLVQKYQGKYSDYLQIQEDTAEPTAPKKAEKPAAPKQSRPASVKKARFTFKEQREYETIDSDIAALEAQQAQNEAHITSAASDFEKLQVLLAKRDDIATQLLHKTDRWFYLNNLAEEIENNR